MSNPSRTRPAICIVNFNGRDYLPATLDRLTELEGSFEDLVLVDDASTDDSVALARRHRPDLRIIELAHNRGPGAARNAGLGALRADRIFFLDNDVMVGSDVLPQLGQALDDDPAAILAMPRVVTASEPDHIEYEGADAHASGLQVLRRAGGSTRTTPAGPPARVGSLVSCCFLLDRSRWGPDPLFDERLRIYFEDHEAGLRARILGHELLAVPGATCLHGEGTPGISLRREGRHTGVRVRNTILSRWQLVLKLYQGRTLLLMSPALALFEAFQLGGALVLGWGRQWFSAAGELVRIAPDLARRRRALARSRMRADRDVLIGGPLPLNPLLAERRAVRATRAVLDRAVTWNWILVRGVRGGG